jgi:arylsulfatase A-like enzyme
MAGAAISLAGLVEGCSSSSDVPPNIVLIFMDDLGYGDIGSYGAQGYATPHLDRLAAEGMRFTDFYASQAVCSASRASLLTGCYSERVSILGALGSTAEIGLHPDEETLADLLKARGYATGIFGKWHLGHRREFLPLQQGFDEYVGVPYSNDMWPVEYDGTRRTEGGKSGQPELPLVEGNETREFIEDLAGQDRLTTLYAERSVAFIEKNLDHPFFLYLAHSMPHVPLGVSDKFRGHSEQGLFGDVIEEIDWSVGEVLSALERGGLQENTLVIFTSDNGPWLNFGNHAGSTGGFREGKGTAFEGGPRVPAIVRWPGQVDAGVVYEGMASTLDILPTVAAATGASLPQRTIDGVNLLPVLKGDTRESPRDHLLFYYGGELRGIRKGKWKRVFEHRTRSYEGVEPGMDGLPGPYASPVVPAALYDLEEDPGETTDVAASNPEVVARLDSLAEAARETLGDRLQGRRGTEVRPPGRRGFQRAEEISHLAVGAEGVLAVLPSPRYPGRGASTLTNGLLGTRAHDDGNWLGFSGDDLDVQIDLGGVLAVSSVAVDCLSSQGAWIFLPSWVEVAVSRDGREWQSAGRIQEPVERLPGTEVARLTVEFPADTGPVRYLRVRAGNYGPLPEWHAAPGEPAWLFVDEIVVQ